MKIKKIFISHFRSIKEQIVDCNSQTIFIGGNGAGKSTILKALHAFFDISFKPTKEDHFAHDEKEAIEITVIFSHFTDLEAKDFEIRIHNGEMHVTRMFGGPHSETGTYQTLIKGCPDFQAVRSAPNATAAKEEYGKLSTKGYKLPKWTKQADVEEAFAKWEGEHSDKCKFIKDGGQFFGAKNVGGGKLQKAANFIMIEAVRDVTEDANDQKSSPIAQLMDLIVRSAMKQNEKITNYQEEVNTHYATLTSPENFPQLGSLETALTASLNTYYQDIGVKLNWREATNVSLPPPQAEIKFREDNFEFPVEKAGNGVQRAFIIALLHQLLVAKTNNSSAANENAQVEEEKKKELKDDGDSEKLPSVILAIEEPELYQHPTKQWHFAQVLRRLSAGELENIFGDVQVLFCTHSPNFVNLSDFHDIQIATKEPCATTGVKHTILHTAALSDIAQMIERTWEFAKDSCTEESTKARLHIFGTELSEGFFSDGVILVEGATDKAALEIVAATMGKNFIENNIAVLAVSGKNNMDRPWMVFTKLGIPVYPLWDSDADGDTAEAKTTSAKVNKALQRMLEVPTPVDFPKGAHKQYACFENNLNEQLKQDFGDDDYTVACREALENANLTARKGMKNPYVIRNILQSLLQKGKKASSLEEIITKAFEHIQPRKNKPEDNKKVKKAAA